MIARRGREVPKLLAVAGGTARGKLQGRAGAPASSMSDSEGSGPSGKAAQLRITINAMKGGPCGLGRLGHN